MVDDLMMGGPLEGKRSHEKKPGVPVDPFRVRRALWGGRKKLLLAAAVGLVLGYGIAKLFVASPFKTTALIKYQGEPEIEGVPVSDQGSLGAAAEALTLQPVLRRIKERTGFPADLTGLSKLIKHGVDHQSKVIRIFVSESSAEGVAKFSRIVTEVFIEYHEELHQKRIEEAIIGIDKRIAAAEREAEQARAKYNSFREQHGIADLSTEQRNKLESAARLNARAELATSEIRALEARVQSLEEQLANTPKTVSVGGGSPEAAQYRKLRAELATARTTLSEQHPRVQALKQQVAELKSRMGSSPAIGGGTVAASGTYQALQQQLRTAQANLEALREQQKGLRELADKAQGRVESFSQIEGQASSLLAQVKVDEQLVTDLKGTKTRLEDDLQHPSSGFVVLDPGAKPEYAERSRTKYLVFAGLPLGFFLGMMLWLLGREFRGLRVRTPAEISYWGGAPVVGATAWPNQPDALDHLIADLDDYAPDSKGSLLVVGATDHEETLVADLTERLSHDWFPDAEAVAEIDPDTLATAPAMHTPQGPLVTPGRDSTTTEGSGPIPMPPPTAQYPMTHDGPVSRSTALATRRGSNLGAAIQAHVQAAAPAIEIEAWSGPAEGQPLRRAARLADRVLVIVPSGALSAMEVRAIRTRIGRDKGVGYLVTGLDRAFVGLPDRAGDVDSFWNV